MIDWIIKTYQYEFWAIERYLKEAIDINNNELIPLDTRISTILSHIILAQRIWISRIRNTEVPYEPWTNVTLDETMSMFRNNKVVFDQYLLNVDIDSLNKEINYKNTKGMEFTTKIIDILTHLSHHSAYHRGQLSQLFKANNIPIPPTDYILFIRENS